MRRNIEMFRYTFGLLMLPALVVCGSSCRNEKISYKLSRGGYSPSTNTLLLLVRVDLGEPLKGSFLATYDEEKGSLTHLLYPTISGTCDFAWAPGQAIFVVTHSDRMTLFQKDPTSERGYSGTAIRCPVNALYMFCSWNPKGEWLAVNCFDLEKGCHRLGLYDLKEEKCVISDILMDAGCPPVWKDDATLYVTSDNNIVEVRVESGVPRLVRTIPIEEGEWAAIFYGMFDDRALVLRYKEIKLGNKTLVELDRATRNRVITTDTTIFVSACSTNLVAFDHEGREIDRTNPGRTIYFGSIGKDPNTVYGLADSVLLRIRVENGRLNIHQVCDLAGFE